MSQYLNKMIVFSGVILMAWSSLFSQLDLNYQTPPQEILELADVNLPPQVIFNGKGDYAVMIFRSQFLSLEDLIEADLPLAGMRINPRTHMSSQMRFYNDLTVLNVNLRKTIKVSGLPENPRLANFSWSPDQSMMAFTHTTAHGIELWVLYIKAAKAVRIMENGLNSVLGEPFVWFKNNQSLLVKAVPADTKPLINENDTLPKGPVVSVSDGSKAQHVTYRNLLKNKNDEYNFEQLAMSELFKIDLNGNQQLWKERALHEDLDFSPDGRYVLVSTISRPFSYLVPFDHFPIETAVYSNSGTMLQMIAKIPLQEVMPQGLSATRQGMREIQWRSDKPATLFWVEALDQGDPKIAADFRDQLFEWTAPFTQPIKPLLKVRNRFKRILWGNDQLAIAIDSWWTTRNSKTYLFNPSNSNAQNRILFDRNYQNKYGDPGVFLKKANRYGIDVLKINQDRLYMLGDGYAPNSIRPFFSEFNYKTQKVKKIWQADGLKTYEKIIDVIDAENKILLTRSESKTDFPNYYLRDLKKNTKEAVTQFANPFKKLQAVKKEVILYRRDDGLELSAVMYLPLDYQPEKKYPMIMYAYPEEFKDKDTAGQTSVSPHQFVYPGYFSFIYWVSRGYVVLDDVSFPIVGEGSTEANDTFIPQLVANAKAAIDAVDRLGYLDRKKVAVAGHSYGAFMVANLLTHSDLFAAGIARSGAYNRTLTPFGFQREERNYWDAPEIYLKMSPFMHSNLMKTPLLLIHGADDNNPGTHTMQSERYFHALKGLGAPVRLVLLPKESHSYRARESILHFLWEQDQWLEKYLKK